MLISLRWWTLWAFVLAGCLSRGQDAESRQQPRETDVVSEQQPNREDDIARQDVSADDARWLTARQSMVEKQIRARGIKNPLVLDAMQRVPRHLFVPLPFRDQAYADSPQPIGHDQTISQPYIVALMTEAVRPQPGHKALDIGTGCGYQAAVLAEIVEHVYSIEIVKPLAEEAAQRLAQLGYRNIEVRHGDGYQGWPEHAPFDVIIVAAAPDHVPQPLVDQLAPGGRMVIPVGVYQQRLLLIEKLNDGKVRETELAPVAFVPMTGQAREGPPK